MSTKNTKCLNCLSVFTNLYNLSFCPDCGSDEKLFEFTTNTETELSTEEKMIVLIDEMLEHLNQARNTIDELQQKLESNQND